MDLRCLPASSYLCVDMVLCQHGVARLIVGLHDSKGHSKPKQFRDSMRNLISTRFQLPRIYWYPFYAFQPTTQDTDATFCL